MGVIHIGSFNKYIIYMCCDTNAPSKKPVHMNMSVNFLFMFTIICLCTLYNLVRGWTSYWEICCIYFLYFIYFANASQSLLTCVHDGWWTRICLNLSFSCRMRWNTYICSWFLNISFILLSFKMFVNPMNQTSYLNIFSSLCCLFSDSN